MKLQVNIKPMTVNQAWCGRKFKTPKYKQWREEFSWIIKDCKLHNEEVKWCTLDLKFYIKHYATTDIDNLLKPLLDALQESGILLDDKYVKRITAEKFKSKKEYIEILITPIK
jgi:Holliday junction resolvase RusA-like endonuclease